MDYNVWGFKEYPDLLNPYVGYMGYLKVWHSNDGCTYSTAWEPAKNRGDNLDAQKVDNFIQNEKWLHTRDAMTGFCTSHGFELKTDVNTFYMMYFRDDLYTYVVRCQLHHGDYSAIIYVYNGEQLEHYIEKAKKGVRVVDANYGNDWYVTNGGIIEMCDIVNQNKTKHSCWYIDDTHFILSPNSVFHICQFAEMCKTNHIEVRKES